MPDRKAYHAAWYQENKTRLAALRKMNKEQRAVYCAANKERRAATNAAYRAAHKERLAALRTTRERIKRYGTCGTELFQEQNGLCGICKDDLAALLPRHRHIDHCHSTGQVRAWLCHKCNTAIGLLRDDPALCLTAAKYLTEKGKWK